MERGLFVVRRGDESKKGGGREKERVRLAALFGTDAYMRCEGG